MARHRRRAQSEGDEGFLVGGVGERLAQSRGEERRGSVARGYPPIVVKGLCFVLVIE
jgi:hypothetical protein